MSLYLLSSIDLYLSSLYFLFYFFFFFSSRRRHTRLQGDWSSDVCSSDLSGARGREARRAGAGRGRADGETRREGRRPGAVRFRRRIRNRVPRLRHNDLVRCDHVLRVRPPSPGGGGRRGNIRDGRRVGDPLSGLRHNDLVRCDHVLRVRPPDGGRRQGLEEGPGQREEGHEEESDLSRVVESTLTRRAGSRPFGFLTFFGRISTIFGDFYPHEMIKAFSPYSSAILPRENRCVSG